MPVSLLPKVITNQITDLTSVYLSGCGIRLLMMDFDNTIVPYTTDVPADDILRWLADMKTSEIQLCIVSNSKRNRVKDFAYRYDIPCITHAGKPGTKGIRKCLQCFHVEPEHAALVGDQIFTDTLGANCAGVTSILVRAIDNHNFWLKARHVAELPFIFVAKRRRLKYEKH